MTAVTWTWLYYRSFLEDLESTLSFLMEYNSEKGFAIKDDFQTILPKKENRKSILQFMEDLNLIKKIPSERTSCYGITEEGRLYLQSENRTKCLHRLLYKHVLHYSYFYNYILENEFYQFSKLQIIEKMVLNSSYDFGVRIFDWKSAENVLKLMVDLGVLSLDQEKNIYCVNREYQTGFNHKAFEELTIDKLRSDPQMFTKELCSYFKLKPSQKVDKILEKITENLEFNISKCKQGPSYKFAEGTYNVLGRINYNLGIFYYAEGYNRDDFKEYVENVIKNVEDSEHDFVVVLVCPYSKIPPIKENLKIRKMENRIFIEELSSDSLREILEDDIEGLKNNIRESMKIYVKEAFEKGFTLPLTGFKEKIQNKPSLLRNKFVDEVGRAWSIELQASDPTKSEILDSKTKAIDGDGKLLDLARNSLKEFIKLDEDDIIRGCEFSRYEKRFLELFDIEKEAISKNEIESSMKKYFSSYSRFSIPDFIGRILEKKNILEIHGDFYKIKKPGDYLQRIVDILNWSLITLVSRNDILTQEKISSLKIIVEELKGKPSTDITWTDIATYNTKLDSIARFLEEKTEQLDIQHIKEKLNLLKKCLDKRFLDLDISDIEFSEPPKNPVIEKYFAETGKSKIDFDSLVSFINEEIKEPISFNQRVMNDIKSILTSIHEIDSSYESIVTPLFKRLENLKMDLEAPRIEKLMDYEYGHSYSSSQIKKAEEILESFNQFLEPYLKSLESLNELYPELRDVFDYIEGHSDYMEDLKIDPDEEEVRIKRLAKNEFNLCEPYLRHILKEYEDLKERIDLRIKYTKLHEFFEGLGLHENVTEDELKVKIEEKKKRISMNLSTSPLMR